MKQRMTLKRDQIYCGNLLLVNAQHPLQSPEGNDLLPVDLRFPEILLRREAANMLQQIFRKIDAGDEIIPVSGYRSGEEQTAIYENSLRENGKEFTAKYVALPDCSEHQTGLAIDLGLNQENLDWIRPAFPDEGICARFREAAAGYGFIERYPQGKEAVTGISHEPWHFRYVGYPHARIMEERGLCLEEYMAFLETCREGCGLVYWQADGMEAEIYYVPAEDDKTQLILPERAVYQVSGNNVNGFIVTVYHSSLEGFR